MSSPRSNLLSYPLALWIDSCRPDEVQRAVESGVAGATTNPSLVLRAIRAESRWRVRARELAEALGVETAAAALSYAIRLEAARLLLPQFEASGGRLGTICCQVDPRLHDDCDRMVEEARKLSDLSPNVSVKLPVTAAGLEAIREATATGTSVTATVAFSFCQVRAVCRAYEAGLRWLPSHLPVPRIHAVLMVGRLDDYLRTYCKEKGIEMPEEMIAQAGVAVGWRTQQWLAAESPSVKLLIGAARGLRHVVAFLSMPVILTVGWLLLQEAMEGSGELRPGKGASPEALRALEALPDFQRAYQPGGMTLDEFALFGPTCRTLSEFVEAQEGLLTFIRESKGEPGRA